MENKKKYRGVNWGSILLFILIIGGILWMANKVQMHWQEISYSTFVKEVEAGNVTAADLRQNSAVPTGRVTLSLKDDSSVRSLNVSDVGKVEEFLQENDVKYSLEDVPKESMRYLFTVYADEPSEWRNKFKSDEFRKEPCKNEYTE